MNKLISKYKISIDTFQNVTTNLNLAKKDDIVFYRITDSDNSKELFFSRLSEGDAGLVITNIDVGIDNSVIVDINDFYELQKEIADTLYPVTRSVKLIGVTGTNGKSSVTHLCQLILNQNSFRACSIGTVGVIQNEETIYPELGATTPSYIDLRRIIFTLKNIDYFCIEVSSHALDQNRVRDMSFSSIGWTNITQDHLDYHGDMESYFMAKAQLENYCDDKFKIPSRELSLKENLEKHDISFNIAPLITREYAEEFNLDYNRSNLEMAFALCESATAKEMNKNIDLKLPKGRFNLFRKNNSVYIVDYAHTPDAIENVCRETKKQFNEYNLITVFGCGGDRDRKKRPLMLSAALEYSDSVVITSDNPRSEDPLSIIEDITRKSNAQFEVVVDREEAIASVVKDYSEKTVVIIAGKGHEEYQEINGVKYHFSDIEVLNKYLGRQ